jgi:hypothetical protein|tara:strand:+ start:497 stop:682 length:186 start_codon:yes stop_codon:yes gene_type:complete
METKFPNIEVQLTGTDGNAFSVIGKVKRALPRDVQDEFMNEATSGGYDNVLATAMRWVNVR